MKLDSNNVIITFKENQYKIKIKALMEVIIALENKKLEFEDEKQLMKLLDKYSLMDELFLSELSKY